MSDRRFEEAAIEYAAAGYFVFPCRPRTKVPLTPNGFKDASRNERTILQWWDRRRDANIAIACGASGICVLDADAKYGADPEEVVAELDLERAPFVWTGEAPERSEKYPNSLEGERGGHIYFRGNLPTADNVLPGCEIRGVGAYVLVPPSVHESGVPYLGNLPPVEKLPEVTERLRRLVAERKSATNGAAPAVEGDIPALRNNTLISLAGSMRRRGHLENEILAALRETNKRCTPQLDDAEVAKVARSVMRYEPSDVPWQEDEIENRRGARIRWLREDDIKPIRFLEEGRIPLGSLTSQTADGGMAKGLWSCRRAALLTLGKLPGAYYGTPINVFVIGTAEDGYEILTSRIKAAGGDVSRVGSLEHELDQEFDLVTDIDLIEKAIQDGDFKAGWLDQVLDHFPDENNSHIQKDVRKTLRPMQRLCNRLDIATWFHAHPSLSSSGPRGIREGGSVQFRNVVRSGLIIGWHPDVDGVRVLAHSKFNGGPLAPSIVFSAEPATVVSPLTGEIVSVGVIANPVEDPLLRWQAVRFDPPREQGEPKGDVIEQTMRELGSDGEWHSRREAEEACIEAGAGAGTFATRFPKLDFIETERRPTEKGQEVWWRLK